MLNHLSTTFSPLQLSLVQNPKTPVHPIPSSFSSSSASLSPLALHNTAPNPLALLQCLLGGKFSWLY
jgi:hypothetical protein